MPLVQKTSTARVGLTPQTVLQVDMRSGAEAETPEWIDVPGEVAWMLPAAAWRFPGRQSLALFLFGPDYSGSELVPEGAHLQGITLQYKRINPGNEWAQQAVIESVLCMLKENQQGLPKPYGQGVASGAPWQFGETVRSVQMIQNIPPLEIDDLSSVGTGFYLAVGNLSGQIDYDFGIADPQFTVRYLVEE